MEAANKTTPSKGMPVSWYMRLVCLCNTQRQSYIKIRQQCPIKQSTVKNIYLTANN
jgi:hypothetical protein